MSFNPATIEALKAAASEEDMPASRYAERAIKAFLAARQLTGSVI